MFNHYGVDYDVRDEKQSKQGVKALKECDAIKHLSKEASVIVTFYL